MYIERFFEFFHKHNKILQYFHNKLSCQFNIGQIKKKKYICTLTHHNLKQWCYKNVVKFYYVPKLSSLL